MSVTRPSHSLLTQNVLRRSSKLSILRLSLSVTSQLKLITSTRRARTRTPAWSVTCNSRAGPAIGRSTRARRQRRKLGTRGSCPRKRPIEVRSLYTRRTTENPSGTDCCRCACACSCGTDSASERSPTHCDYDIFVKTLAKSYMESSASAMRSSIISSARERPSN